MRLVVGTINLVEKIAQLAKLPMGEVKNLPADELQKGSPGSRVGDDGRQSQAAARSADRQPADTSEKEIIKEGLSEYFIYTIEGTETIPNGWSKRMRSFKGNEVPVQDPVPLSPAGIRRPARADVSADQQQGIEARHHAAAGRHRPRLPRQRPRRPLVPDAAVDQVHSRSATRSSSTWAPIPKWSSS